MNKDLLMQLYNQYAKELYIFLYSLCKNRDLTEDLLQEVFLKAILSLNEHHTNFRAWLYMVAKNLCFNQLKKEKRSFPVDTLPEQVVLNGVLEKVIQNDKNKTLYIGIMELPEMLRQVIVLQYFSDLSQKEIASVMEISNENVRVISFRAKKILKKFMEVNGYEI